MEAQAARRRIAEFPRWDYRFEFENGLSAPVSERARVNRQTQRYAYFFERLLELTGASLEGFICSRTLDLSELPAEKHVRAPCGYAIPGR
jgi:hypothetical protein